MMAALRVVICTHYKKKKIWFKLETCMHTAIAATVSHSPRWSIQEAEFLMVVETVMETVSGLPLNPTGAAWH